MPNTNVEDEELRKIDEFMLSHGFVMYPGDPVEMKLPWKARWYFPGGQTYTNGSKGNMTVDVERGMFWYQIIEAEKEKSANEASAYILQHYHDALFKELPTGNVDAFALLRTVQVHLKNVSTAIDALTSTKDKVASEWIDYRPGDYEKKWYDIKTKAGHIYYSCWPNSGRFNTADSKSSVNELIVTKVRLSETDDMGMPQRRTSHE